ncbi:DUF2189 domain-containing protein [Nitratireductor sp. ZSWI3]|uniref:DUF2189 domain-containing protein n=1 Tax=Nitratireductor sp. ZSWI3 TaxID=2966359 RepID=UPI00214F6604|nr:DUF2189 domain-containing protein [Nitratireductor sp. ZSWI3]MCR4264912.1 DUF2189 domain-containing protein [Nitratireductor sp. ZSWI3]
MTSFHVIAGAQKTVAHPRLRTIDFADVLGALRSGVEDFWDKPSHYVFLCLIYPIVGVILITWASSGNALQLIFPLIAGFALLGPFAAIGLYEISRRRERGMDTSWRHAFDVRKSAAIPSMVAIGIMLLGIFLVWIFTAQGLYRWLYGDSAPASLIGFIQEVLTTQRGWTLLLVGNLVGFIFALIVLSTTSIAFPLLLDRDVGAYAAIETSVRVMQANPLPMLLWGFIVAALLVIGSLPLFVGLAVVIPVLGHATWHLYRKTVISPTGKEKTPAQS